MRLWQRTIHELQMLLEQQGAFRSIRIWQLLYDPQKKKQPILSVGAHTKHETARRRSSRELVDPAQRRLILVVSDCVSPAWYDNTMLKMIETWGRKNHVSIVQMLSKRLCPRSGLRNGFATELHLPEPASPNSRIRDAEGLAKGLCVPVTTVDSFSLTKWAAACAEGGTHKTDGYVFEAGFRAVDPPPALDNFTPQKRVERFWNASSEPVRRLAGLLSFLPLTPPVIRLVQRTMFPEHQRRPMDIAEVLLGGLVNEVRTNGSSDDPDDLQFEFVDGVRDVLAATRLITEHEQVLVAISDYIAEQTGKPSAFRALLAAAATSSDLLSL